MKHTPLVLLRSFLLVFATVLFLSPLRAAYTPPVAASLELNFNPVWRVAQGSFPVEGVDDSGWERVATPHTYHERQAYQGLKNGLRDLGAFTYRKHFSVPADYAGTSAGEGVVFKIGAVGRVYVAYDDGNVQFPAVSSPTPIKTTTDKLLINGRPHTIYRSGDMNGGELTYIGTNSWTEQAPAGLNNYVVFVTAEKPTP